MRVLFEELGAGEFAAEEYTATVDSPVVLALELVKEQVASLGIASSVVGFLSL